MTKFTKFLMFMILMLTGVCLSGVWGIAYTTAHPVRDDFAPDENPLKYGVPYQDITLKSIDGLNIQAWYTPAQNGTVVIFVHGFRGHRAIDRHCWLATAGFGVISIDLRAHGLSDGNVTSFGYHEGMDVHAALNFALSQPGIDRVVGYGESLGGATLIGAASTRPEIAALVVDSTFSSLSALLERQVPIYGVNWLFKGFWGQQMGVSVDAVNPSAWITKIAPRPILIIQAQGDSLIPADSATVLARAYGETAQVWLEAGLEHSLVYHTYPEVYKARVIEFLR
ncbi:MAG TPA: alpha/beta fold hydrolase [Anaerolineales bacterium]|nr:alpha/beta fold hydrolase [Anaerolineales bacterium]